MDIKVLPYIDTEKLNERTRSAAAEKKNTSREISEKSFQGSLAAAQRAIESVTIDLIVSQDAAKIRQAADILSQSSNARLREIGKNLINTGAGTGRALTPEQLLGDENRRLGDSVSQTSGSASSTKEASLSAEKSYKADANTTAAADKAAEALGCPDSLKPYFIKASKKYNVDVALLMAIAKQESDFQSDCVSHAGATGIMQIMPATAKELGVKDLYDPEDNILGGAKEISSRLKDYNGDLDLALAGYNAGIGNVRKYGGIPPFKETKNYIKKVNAYYKQAS